MTPVWRQMLKNQPWLQQIYVHSLGNTSTQTSTTRGIDSDVLIALVSTERERERERDGFSGFRSLCVASRGQITAVEQSLTVVVVVSCSAHFLLRECARPLYLLMEFSTSAYQRVYHFFFCPLSSFAVLFGKLALQLWKRDTVPRKNLDMFYVTYTFHFFFIPVMLRVNCFCRIFASIRDIYYGRAQVVLLSQRLINRAESYCLSSSLSLPLR